MLDYHLHLWEHGPGPVESTLEQVAAYCERATSAGVQEVAITEHLSRFRQADRVLKGWWDDDPSPALARAMGTSWEEEQGADLDRYVDVVLAAKAEGLPVVLGMEVDYYEDRMDEVGELLAGYPFDVLLGSVHWLGSWCFDNPGEPAFAAEWESRPVEAVWEAYTRALEELADSGTCDVLAHPDLCKIMGHRPPVPDEWHVRMAEAAARSGMAAEVSTAGLNKPVGEAYPAPDLLARFAAAGVPFTTASDAHRLDRVAERRDDVRSLLATVGCTSLQAYRGRRPRTVALG
jgi:histidinol-phosphatase (PHP family)